jgi:cyclic beta-1,2-glucan synthetase
MVKGGMRYGIILAVWLQAALIQAPPLCLLDAKQQGSFNIGAAQATISREFEEAPLNRDLLIIDYSIPDQTAAGVWAKEYPIALAAGSIDTVELGIYIPEGQLANVALAVEIKGSTGTQRFPVRLGPGWNTTRELIDWKKIGSLSETVLLIQRTGGDNPAAGRIRLDMTFRKLPLWQKLRTTLWGRLGGVTVFSLLLSMLVSVIRRKMKVAVTGVARDLTFGVATVLIASSVLGVYAIGKMNPLNSGWICFYVAGAGVLISLLLKLTLAGRPVFAGETLRSALFPGLLAAAASEHVLWQVPDSLAGFFQLSGFGAALFVLIYHVANLCNLTARRKHLGIIGGATIIATPFVFGLLLAMQAFHNFVIQALLIFAVGELLANASSLINRERPLSSLKVHRALFLLSVLVTAAPTVADLGSGAFAASIPALLRPFAIVLATMFSQAPLWGIVYLFTGLILGTMHGRAPSGTVAQDDAIRGMKKGMVFSGVLMGLLQLFYALVNTSWIQNFYTDAPAMLLTLAGVAVFPLFKTIIETFDGSQSFFGRVASAYKDPVLYLRGLVLGLAFAIGLSINFASLQTSQRIWFGFAAGAAIFGGVSLARDLLFGLYGIGGIKSWRYYLVESGLGAFIGAGIGFYLDASQLPIIGTKFELYNSFGLNPAEIVTRCQQLRTTAPNEFTALISRWGHIKLSAASGGAKILFNEALMGVIGWGIAAPLFAINKAFLSALLNRDVSSIKRIATRAGITELADGTVYVLRWGLWMAPLIFSFLRPMAEAAWYNQDGLIRTFFAIFNSLTRDASGFTAWSLTVFSWIIGYAWFQILIWIDHMGLRVATLVNLSFLGVDRLDERCATFVGPEATARFIPEGVKRFTTWAPLLIPFYLPKGEQWAQVFNTGAAIQAKQAGAVPGLAALILIAVAAAVMVTLMFTLRRRIRERREEETEQTFGLINNKYEVELKKSGEINSFLTSNRFGISRCAFEKVDPSGRILFVVEVGANGAAHKAWPVLGNFPEELFTPSSYEGDSDRIKVVNISNEVRVTVTIKLPGRNDAVELWTVELEDLSGKARDLKVVPYLEWMLNRAEADRNHTQYNRLYPEMSYHAEINAMLAFHRSTKLYGILASADTPAGVLTGRIDFIGRAGNIWTPRALETLTFREARDAEACPTFDPIGSLLLNAPVPANGRLSHRILIGGCEHKARAAQMVMKYLRPQTISPLREQKQAEHPLKIGHGEIPPGTPDHYTEYVDDGNTLRVLTPFTPRPFDHEMANSLGHVMAVTNHGLHSSASGNAQQNRLTPDWADLAGNQVPSEAIYLYDEKTGDWFSPCYDPLKDRTAAHDVFFSLDGSAVFKMQKGGLETELSVHVPLDEPAGVYLLKIRNTGVATRRLRVAPYFQIALAHSPEYAGSLLVSRDAVSGALYFENPRNHFRTGSCFAAMSEPVEQFATRRDRFFGAGRTFAHPMMVETGAVAPAAGDELPVAALLTTIEIPAGGEKVISIVLGEADTRRQAKACVKKFQTLENAEQSLQSTRDWWMALQSTLKVETGDPEFDAYVKWMKYQTLSERIWARKGFYQASGAFGFRDQLQDTVNMIWVDPALARAQLVLHAAQQFPEGDAAHWFFLQQDGRTGFLSRSHASDNLIWLGWGVGEYVRMTGDKTLLDEKVSYLKAETPLLPLPEGKHGMGFFPLRSPRSDSVYNHVMRAVDLVLTQRMGRNGLPLMGTGDWNDGLDEIGSKGRGESVWMAFFLTYVLKTLLPIIRERGGKKRRQYYEQQLRILGRSIEKVWRGDRYLRAIHDDGTEIGVAGAGSWETDALGAAWAVFAGVNPQRSRIALDTALSILESEKVISLGYPPLRENTRPYLGRSSTYPEGVRENGMYSHGVQWLTRACRLLSEQFAAQGDQVTAQYYRDAAVRLWYKISAIPHTRSGEVENYGGQPNKQCADYLTVHDPGRMIWSGYTGAAGWMLRQACESVVGATLVDNKVILPADLNQSRGGLTINRIRRNLAKSPLKN